MKCYYLYLYYTMSSVSTTNCNLNCICLNNDCLYAHYIPYKERKIVKRFYDAINGKNINEPNIDNRKKNCTFGQLCEKETCGYKHRLSFADREKLIVSYKFNKICPEHSQVAKTSNTKSDEPQLDIQNSFSLLEDEKEEEEIIHEIKTDNKTKSWASIVKNEKPIFEEEEVVAVVVAAVNTTLNWEDCADDDFYMNFE
uniref:Uncharacterized protein n=1 Tax=viral metagenome TaxID=1070528 RepID=A0A6C0LEV2_9ZZZZ